MCGRFAVTTDPALLAQKIQALDETTAAAQGAAGASAANYNVAPTTAISTVVKRHAEPEDEATRRLRSMRWGLIPPWAKTGPDGKLEGKGPLLINARAETVTESPAFRNSAKNKRCLVPMDGWYEWTPNRDAKGHKTPFYLHAEDGEPLFMAGLWSTWRPKGADRSVPPLLSATIITTDAVGPLAEIHDRMPLTISRPDWDRWMDPDAPIDEGLLRGHGDLDRIVVRQVSTLVNNVRNNGPELIAPADPQAEQAELF
ncbi:SOS response-associated peptidase [[Mycobacterium] burgundiense]|jgi:putative SOS response-associated peptidase YedK|uniref:Abasic site processing protein n=1 Tax=[Mycobacterium] burgundiense TaxID=3064286 RepID=A0ABM9LZL5_9MYCO|nr:SOS response-associated peptidase [Mycolicibacterium sp. MU0053]CAJ1507518.1 SOS response-associated peptidase [Mycolicibacterium sp. MU0053]